MEMKPPIRVLITGVAGGTIGEQLFKTLRRGRHQYEITVTNVVANLTSVVPSEHVAVLPPASSKEYLDVLMKLIQQQQIEFVIPGSEPELIQISRNRELLLSCGVHLLINSDEVITASIDKLKVNRLLKQKGFAVPSTFSVPDVSALEANDVVLPSVIKPAIGSGSAAVFLAQTLDEVRFFVQYLLDNGHQPVVQEYTGTAENEFTVGVLHLPDGTFAGSVVLQRQILSGLSNRFRLSNRTSRSELGNVLALSSGISQGKVVDFPGVRDQAEAIGTALGSVGPLNVQGRWDGERFLAFEINPRFSGTTPIRAMAGFNEPEILIDWYLRIPFESQTPQTGLEFVRGLSEYHLRNPVDSFE